MSSTDTLRAPWRQAISWTWNLVNASKGRRQASTKLPRNGGPRQQGMGKKQGALLAGGVILLVAGIVLALTWDSILQAQVNKEFILTEKSTTYEPWRKSNVEVYIKFWFWNWTNPEGIKDPDYKPILVECGPYAYLETAEKVNIIWNRNGTVTYNRRRRWYFDPLMSNGSEDDVITSLNVVAKSAAYMTRYDNYFRRKPLSLLLATQSIHISKSVRELLFEGYKSPLIDTAQTFSALSQVKVPFDRFGWFYKRNGSTEADGVFNVETGVNGMDHFGEIRSWNYWNQTPFYDAECGSVSGSGGEFFPPGRTQLDVIKLFSPDLCRYVTFNYEREEEIYGIPGYRYEFKSSLLDNGEEDSGNECFCNREAGDCAPSGALNVSACRFGAPAFVSFPHFYNADSVYKDAVIGMKPDPSKHNGFITMEPTYAVTLEVAARFQINILLQPYDDISLYSGIPEIYFPVMWFEQTAKIPSDTAAAVRTLLLLPKIGLSAAALLALTGAAMIAFVIMHKICTTSKQLPISEENRKAAEPMMNAGIIRQENGKDTVRWDTKM